MGSYIYYLSLKIISLLSIGRVLKSIKKLIRVILSTSCLFFYQNRLYHEWSIFSEIKIISLCCSLKIAGSSLQIRWLISVWQVPIILSLFSMRMSAIHIELFNFSNQGYVKSTEMSKTAISCNPIPSMCKTDLQKPHS